MKALHIMLEASPSITSESEAFPSLFPVDPWYGDFYMCRCHKKAKTMMGIGILKIFIKILQY